MLSNLLLLCFTAHVLGDFYLQSDKTARSKNKNLGRLIYHALIYSIPFAVIFAITGLSLRHGVFWLIPCAAHLGIDLLKFGFYKSGLHKLCADKLKIKDWTIYLVDQSLHIVSILVIVLFFGSFFGKIQIYPALAGFFTPLGIDAVPLLKWFLLILCIYKPANVTFIKLFSNYKPDSRENPSISVSTGSKLDKRAGAIIGFLERILIVIFISIQQYSAIGLILTAKSIARYDNIVKNQDFAEYYLIGTLSSVLFSVVLYAAIF